MQTVLLFMFKFLKINELTFFEEASKSGLNHRKHFLI